MHDMTCLFGILFAGDVLPLHWDPTVDTSMSGNLELLRCEVPLDAPREVLQEYVSEVSKATCCNCQIIRAGL